MGGRDSEPPPTLPDLLGAGAFILHAGLPLRSCRTIMAPPVQGASQYGTSCAGGLPIWHLLRRGPPNMAPPVQGASQYGTSCAGGLPIWHLLRRGPPNMAPPAQGASQYGTSCAGGLPIWHLLRRGPPNMAPPAQAASQYGTSCLTFYWSDLVYGSRCLYMKHSYSLLL